ncbi:PREDICTED: uncharacterized protein LOC109176041 [Ipomoea nil]|uniref:uncharacterized protein LOC109176041 n=1 Tax=Ipomoea nil TaxID=35883 RepID=UPI000901F2E9|nr:PREDICTED: uncharacterized protein LOC109176041 [Ipomoea nil]
MASSSSDPMDDDSFRARVHKVFGSLSSSPSSMSPALKPLWSLTDEEVEKREWNRSQGKDDDQTICSSSFDGMFKRNRRDARPKGLGDDLEDLSGDEDGNRKGLDDDLEDGDSRDVREIRSSIGLDSTLDNEEEEDEYDRLAEGKGKARNCFRKDPRADQIAAQVRLKEDAAEAAKYEPNFSNTEVSGEKHEESKATSDDCSKLKPILKRKGMGELRSKKRVRFDPSFVDESEDAPERAPVFSDASSTEDTKARDCDSLFDENKPKVPDHLINPSKYTRYSLESCGEVDDESNSLVCRYVLEEVKKWKNNLQTEEPSNTLPKSVSFVPKKKTNSAIVMEDASEDASKEIPNQQSIPVGIAAWEAQRGDSAPEEDDMQMDTSEDTGICKPDRHYRSKSRVEDPVT